MPTMLTGDRLRDAVLNQTLMRNGDAGCSEGVKYDFRLSNHILKAKFGRPIDASEVSSDQLFIEPGEMVFALSEERLNLPSNVMAELSPKRKLSHGGILVIGGFCIDPGYTGRLLIGLFNVSSTRFPLIPKKKVIAATFYELEGNELMGSLVPVAPVDDFPDELITTMQRYSPVAIQSVVELVERLKNDLVGLRDEIRSRDEWYRRFESSLERHDSQIGELISGLKAEKEARESGQDRLSTTLKDIEKILSWLKGAAWVLGILGTVIGGPLLVQWLARASGLAGS